MSVASELPLESRALDRPALDRPALDSVLVVRGLGGGGVNKAIIKISL